MKNRLKMSENPLQKTVEDMFSEFITSQKARILFISILLIYFLPNGINT